MTCFEEPELADVMNDSATQALMAADHVDRVSLEEMFSAVARTLPPKQRCACGCDCA